MNQEKPRLKGKRKEIYESARTRIYQNHLGTRMNKKVIRTADSLLEQIKEYEA